MKANESLAETRLRIEEIKDAILADPLIMRAVLEDLLVHDVCFILLRKPVCVLPAKTIFLNHEKSLYDQVIARQTVASFTQDEILALRRFDLADYWAAERASWFQI